MIITRTPFRISFAGGGSDLEAFYREEPGVVLSTTIDKAMFITAAPRFGGNFRIGYSRTEIVDTADLIEHPIVREALAMLGISTGLEIVSVADLPANTGMGSSSAFTVGLLHALYHMMECTVSPERLAAEACTIEIERLGEPIGKQDQYIAACGGLRLIRFMPDGSVEHQAVPCDPGRQEALEERLLLFYTGQTRDARDVLSRQRAGTGAKRTTLRRMCRIAEEMHELVLGDGDLREFGELLHEAWVEKRSIEQTISNSLIDEWYARGRKAGATGGKILGAGGGGFLLFYCEPEHQDALRAALPELMHVPFRFDPQGSVVVYDRRTD